MSTALPLQEQYDTYVSFFFIKLVISWIFSLSEILKIGQYLRKIWTITKCDIFLRHSVVDETKDLSRKEQLAFLVRYVHEKVIKKRALGVCYA